MDSTLSNYLRILRTPHGQPEAGQVTWDQTDLFGRTANAAVSWTPTSLDVRGQAADDRWAIQMHKQADGWDIVLCEGEVQGGTPLAKMRWAREQIDAVGANPEPSWAVAPRGRRPKA